MRGTFRLSAKRFLAATRLPLKLEIARDAVIPIAMLLIVGATLSWIAYEEYRQTQESEYRLLEAHARNAEVKVADALDRIERLLNQIAETRLKKPALQGETFTSFLTEKKNDIPILGTLLVTDPAGRIRYATDATLIGQAVVQESYFTAHISSGLTPKLFMSRPEKLRGVTTITFTFPIVSADYHFLGIAGATIGYEFFPEVLQSINPDDSESMSVIFNRDGDLVFRRSEPQRFFGINIVNVSKIFQEHSGAGNPVTRHIGPSAQDGRTRLFLVRDVGNSGLSLILSRQLDEVLGAWRRNVVVYVLIFIFALVVVISLSFDTTRRRQLENARQEALSRIHKISSQVPGVVFQSRMHPNGHFSLPYASDAIREIFRVNPDDVRMNASSISSLIHPDDYTAVLDSIRQSARDMTRWHQEYRIRFDDGSVHWLLGSALPQKEGEGVVLWHGFITDISERKQMEMEIVTAKHRAEEANLVKSKFLAAASHDLRQPIHAQGLFLSVLARTDLNAYQREVLANATAASKASSEMLNTLLDFSRIEAGVIEPKMQPFNLQPLLNKLEREFESQADAKGIAYRSRETDLVVRSDPVLVELILRNLVSNAIRYTERGGLLVASRKCGDQAVLEVWDTGIGIAPEHQQEIFREFHQLGNPERDRRKGLGLGLAIADGLARQMVHGLTLDSTVQRGSVFRLSLPIASGTATIEEYLKTSDTSQTLDVRVLFIDDDEIVRESMLHLLNDWGCTCEAAESIEEALALASVQAPDLVISDYRLREQRNGLEAITALRTVLGIDLPALLITGDTSPDRLREAQASGLPLLHKPVMPRQLYRKLVTILAQQLSRPGKPRQVRASLEKQMSAHVERT